ncbi:MAG: hypothetical protein HAW58_06910 [Candidatus Thioglobus sp.]|nr:hypothetical protein [Candidatus Thioglobus sp.]
MNTLTMANTLINAGFDKKQAEAVVEIVGDSHKILATKNDLKLSLVILVGLMGTGFGYVVSILNTIIGKL